MDIQCSCQSCGARFRVDVKFSGRKARCPKCSAVLEVPAVAGVAPAPAPAAASVRTANPAPAAPARPATPTRTTVARPVPSVAATPVASSEPTNAEPAGPVVVTSSRSAVQPGSSGISSNKPAPKARKKGPPVLLLAVSGVALALGAVALVVVFAMQEPAAPQPAKQMAAAGGGPKQLAQATLILDWPAGDRAGGSLMIDKESKLVPATGDAKFSLYPGLHKVLIRRRGFEQIELKLDLKPGQVENYKPEFVAVATPAPSTTTVANNNNDAAFPIGTGVGPRGFGGWMQNIEVAQRKAAAQNKDLLLVFGCSDADGKTQDLVEEVLSRAEFTSAAANYVSVVIDFPRTVEGFNLLEDRASNDRLRRDFMIRELPTVALTDAQGRPYFIEREWENGFGAFLKELPTWQQNKTKRDEMLTKAKAGEEATRLVAAEQALDWLFERKLGPLYRTEVRDWKSLADKLDPQNAQGKLEKFFEVEWLSRASDLSRDERRIKTYSQEVSTFAEQRKFVDHDRAVRLFAIAAQLFMAVGAADDAAKLGEHFAGYEPKDRDLRQTLQAMLRSFKSRNQLSSGTGFVISEAGYLLTNHHVVDGKGKLTVRLPGVEQAVAAKVLAQDPQLDIALVKVEVPSGTKLSAIPLTDAKLGRGANVAAFGYPLGDSLGAGLKLTQGRIAALPDPTADNMLLLDLRVNPGNSGGPLCDNKGNVVGMVTAKTNGLLEDSYGMARPAMELERFLVEHLPADAARPKSSGDKPLEWDEVDQRVSASVLMLVKVKE